MVLHFPSKLTDEEEALQLKYAKLRRKKKQLQEVNKPKQEPEQNKLKRPAEAKDAKEVAKKLLKTGAMKAIKKSLEKEKSKEEKTNLGFKRSMGFERKLNGMDRAMSNYQPFSATHGPGVGFDTGETFLASSALTVYLKVGRTLSRKFRRLCRKQNRRISTRVS